MIKIPTDFNGQKFLEKFGERTYHVKGATQELICPSLPNLTEKDLLDCVTGYKDKRRIEYPPIGDQLDLIFHDMENDTEIWRTEIRRIKNKYPKP